MTSGPKMASRSRRTFVATFWARTLRFTEQDGTTLLSIMLKDIELKKLSEPSESSARPNPAVKRTNIGGAHQIASLTSSAPLFAAYLVR